MLRFRRIRTIAARAGFFLTRRKRARDVALQIQAIKPLPPMEPEETLVATLVRNEAFHIRSFIEHHLERGFDRILIVDNGSTDATVAIAQEYPRVSIYQCTANFATHQIAMREWALQSFGRGRWCLIADADEHFDWPFHERVSLRQLIHRLEKSGSNAMAAHMIDACGDLPNPELDENPNHHRATYPQLYLADYQRRPFFFNQFYHRNKMADPTLPCLHGGLRRTLFGQRDFLTKVPFFHYSGSVRPLIFNAHAIFGARIAATSAVLRHYKVTGDYQQRLLAMLSNNYEKVTRRKLEKCLTTISQSEVFDPGALYEKDAQIVDDVSELQAEGLVQIGPEFADLIDRQAVDTLPDCNAAAPEIVTSGVTA